MKSTHEIGNVGELRVAFEAAKRGYVVSIPIGHDARYDLIVDRNGKLERVQVKTVVSNGEYISVLCRSVGKLNGKHIRKPYTTADIDWLVVYDVTTDKCAYFPASELGSGMDAIVFRLIPTKNNQRRGIRFIEDYQIW